MFFTDFLIKIARMQKRILYTTLSFISALLLGTGSWCTLYSQSTFAAASNQSTAFLDQMPHIDKPIAIKKIEQPVANPLEKMVDTTIIQKTIEPKKETTKIVTVSSATATSIWGAIGKQLKMNHYVNQSQVKKEIKILLSDKKKFQSILKDSAPYIYYIYTQTKIKHLPAEIALIPIIESEFNPNDHSNKGAIGLWQLMPQTARELGIKVNGNYDGRRNVIESTRAALAYFVDLGKFFKSNWYLAIAGYNCGQFKVRSVTRHLGTTNFWRLPLPRETKLYVPKLLAVAEIISHPQKYGVTIPVIGNKPFFTAVTVQKTVSLKSYANQHHINLATLKSLNPDYKSGIAYAHRQLLIPTTA